MPIPLLRSPLLVLGEVIKNMELRQLFLLSFCSKRMHLVVKNLRDKSSKLELTFGGGGGRVALLLFGENIELLFVLRVHEMLEGNLEGWTVDKYRGAVFREEDREIKSYWEGMEEGTRCLLQHVCDLFSVQVEKVGFYKEALLWMMEAVEELQGPRSYKAYCEKAPLTDEQFRHLLVDLNPSSLYLYSQSSEELRIENFHKTYDTLDVWYGNWISGDNLLTLDCATLRMFDATFTVPEINRFFRHVLIDEGAPRLTEFRAQVENTDANGILDEIREVLKPIPGREQFEENERSWKFSGLLERGDRSVVVTIDCYKESSRSIEFKIES